MKSLLPKFVFLFYLLFIFTTLLPPVSCLFQNIHFPRLPPLVKNKSPIGPAQDILEICWGDKKLTITPRVLPTLIEYFRLCTNSVNVFTNPEEPRMLSFLRNKMYAILPDVNRAFLHGAIRYDQGEAVQNALARLDKYMAEKGIPLGESKPYRWLTINTTSPKTFRSRFTSGLQDISHPCRDLVVLDGIDKTNNASLKFIPTPYQDDPLKPKFMAIPFTKQFLYDVAKQNSIGVLIQYYLQSEKCLGTFSVKDVTRFKQSMYNVIVHKFLPVIKADPYRLIPGYAGILEILSDVTESIANSNQARDFKLNQTQPPSIKNKRHKSSNSRQRGQLCNFEDWIWEDGSHNEECVDSNETTNYYRYLLIVLSVLCIFNCLFCLSTLGYYFFLHKRNSRQPSCPDVTRIKRDRTCTSPDRKGSKQSTVWSRARQTLCEGRKTGLHTKLETILCHERTDKRRQAPSTRSGFHSNRDKVPATESGCQGNRSRRNDSRRCCETTHFQQSNPSCGLQQIKCPHNLVSPRPPTSSQPAIPYSCFPGQFGQKLGEISLFNSSPPPCENSSPGYETHQLFHCNTVEQCEDETVQSIQGSEEFQRIVKELYKQKQSFLQLTLSPRMKPEWSDSTALSSRNEKRDKPVLGSVNVSTSKQGSEKWARNQRFQGNGESSRKQGAGELAQNQELARKQRNDLPVQIIQERSNMNIVSSQSKESPRST